MSKDRTSEPLGDVMVARLREAIMKEYPVSVTGLLNNYNLLFHENIKPEEYDCTDMYNFITHVSSKYNIWKVLHEDNQLRIKPSRATVIMMAEKQVGKGPGTSDARPEDAVLQEGFPPLSLPGLKEERIYQVVVTDVISFQKIWFNIYHSDYYIALQSLMTELDNFYSSEAGDKYKVSDITSLKVGSVLAARFKKQQYHRVVLRNILPHKKMVRLEYVDYGTVDIQSVKNCRYLTPRFTQLPAQAIEGRLWRLCPVGGADQKRALNVKLTELLLYDCEPGSLLVEIKSGVNLQEYNCASSEFPVDPESKRVMAFDLFDCVRSGGINIGKHLIDLGLAKQEEGEEVFINGKLGYTKYFADRLQKLYVPSRWKEVTRKETDKDLPSSSLQLLRLYEAGLASKLDQIRAGTVTERSNSASAVIKNIEKIDQYQSRLNAIDQRRREKEVQEGLEEN